MPLLPNESCAQLQARVDQLAQDEYEIYKWLREYYSVRWIAETLLISRCAAKKKIKRVFTVLGVKNKETLIRTYHRLGRPEKRPVDSQAIDNYVDARTEQEIQRRLNKEGGKQNGK